MCECSSSPKWHHVRHAMAPWHKKDECLLNYFFCFGLSSILQLGEAMCNHVFFRSKAEGQSNFVMTSSSSRSNILIKIGAKHVAYAHTIFAYSAFFLALIVGCYTHYEKIVRNEYFGYPDEWFPSVSATTGDRYPARAIFQILIALTAGPRFILVFLWFIYSTRSIRTCSVGFGKFLLFIGLIRTVSCGGWVYITSTDDHMTHDVAMIVYLLCTLPWQLGVIYTSANNNPQALKWRRFLTGAFFASLPPMVYFFLQHKVHQVPGAYTMYAFFEWSLIIYDVAFDAVTALDFQIFELAVVDTKRGKGHAPTSQEGYAVNV